MNAFVLFLFVCFGTTIGRELNNFSNQNSEKEFPEERVLSMTSQSTSTTVKGKEDGDSIVDK